MDEDVMEAASRWREERYRERLARIGLPTRYAGATDPRAASLASALASGDASGLYVYGSVGSGKTWLACAVLREAARRDGCQPRAFGAVSMLSALREGFDGRGGVTMGELRSADVLLVDDLDKPKPTAWSLEALFDLFDSRSACGRPTVVTANSDLAGLRARLAPVDPVLADAICDRVRGGALPVLLTGGSRRGWADAQR